MLLVVANGGHGGMQVQVGLLARALGEVGCAVEVASGPGPLDVAGAPLHPLPQLAAARTPSFARALRQVVADLQPDVVHGHGLRLAPFLAAAARRRSLVTCHGLDPRRARPTASLARLARVPVAACGEGPRRLLASVGLFSRVLDNIVPAMPEGMPRDELCDRYRLPRGALVAVCPARLSPQKDPITLVRALAEAEGVAGVLLGGGPLEAAVRREVESRSLAERVVVAPFTDDARRVLAGADVAVLSSRWEGQPLVVLEAVAAGTAVVATSCVGTVDTLVDGDTGLLSPPRDHAALARSLERARDPELRAALAERARRLLPDHAAAVVATAHLDAYRRVLAGDWT